MWARCHCQLHTKFTNTARMLPAVCQFASKCVYVYSTVAMLSNAVGLSALRGRGARMRRARRKFQSHSTNGSPKHTALPTHATTRLMRGNSEGSAGGLASGAPLQPRVVVSTLTLAPDEAPPYANPAHRQHTNSTPITHIIEATFVGFVCSPIFMYCHVMLL